MHILQYSDDYCAVKYASLNDLIVVCIAQGIESLFPVQSVSFDAIYDGCDVIVQASKYIFGPRRSTSYRWSSMVCWPDCKPEGPLFSPAFVCLSVCL